MDFDKLDEVLKAKKMSRRKLAQAVGIKESTMSTAFMRRSGLSFEDTMKIVRFLGIDVCTLCDCSNLPHQENAPDKRSNESEEKVMNAFENTIKTQLLAYKAEIDAAKAAKRMDKVSQIRTQMSAYRLGLETCLSKNYVSTFFEYIEHLY